jgi:hypothetical protein
LDGHNNAESEGSLAKLKPVMKQEKLTNAEIKKLLVLSTEEVQSRSTLGLSTEVLHGLYFGFLRAEAIPHGSSRNWLPPPPLPLFRAATRPLFASSLSRRAAI